MKKSLKYVLIINVLNLFTGSFLQGSLVMLFQKWGRGLVGNHEEYIKQSEDAKNFSNKEHEKRTEITDDPIYKANKNEFNEKFKKKFSHTSDFNPTNAFDDNPINPVAYYYAHKDLLEEMKKEKEREIQNKKPPIENVHPGNHSNGDDTLKQQEKDLQEQLRKQQQADDLLQAQIKQQLQKELNEIDNLLTVELKTETICFSYEKPSSITTSSISANDKIQMFDENHINELKDLYYEHFIIKKSSKELFKNSLKEYFNNKYKQSIIDKLDKAKDDIGRLKYKGWDIKKELNNNKPFIEMLIDASTRLEPLFIKYAERKALLIEEA